MVTTPVNTSLDGAALDALQTALRGRVLRPGDEGYDAARAVYNAMHDRHPAVIVQAMDTADVVHAVGFAREQGLLLSVKAGAHNVNGFASNDGGMVLDLSGMRSVTVDPRGRLAIVGGGALWADVDQRPTATG